MRSAWRTHRCGTFASCCLITLASIEMRPVVLAKDEPKAWHAPHSCIFTRNPVPSTPASVQRGREVFEARCMGCHGESGHGDGPDAPQLRVTPARLSGERVQSQSDGLLWWKITFGRRPMPGYGFRLTSTDRWHLVNYLRTLADTHRVADKI